MIENVKLRSGNLMIPVALEHRDHRIFFHFQYSKGLIDDIKDSFEGRKYHGFDETNPQKVWSIPTTQRNLFRLAYLKGEKPYARFDSDIKSAIPEVAKYCKKTERPVYAHQLEEVAQALVTGVFYWAAEMGTGKTLAAIIAMEMSGIDDWYWVGPKSALRAVLLEMRKWKSCIAPVFYTYEGLKKLVKEWPSGQRAPRGLLFDESQKLKTPTSQRSIAAKHLALSVREDNPKKNLIGLMSGTPAPKSPLDYWNQCEIACPGFLREKDLPTFRNTLAIMEQRGGEDGQGAYPVLLGWRDDEKLCNLCHQPKEHFNHIYCLENPQNTHTFIPSQNEVARLAKRLRGLVLVKFKRDCTDLPEKVYDVIRVTPTAETLRAADLIVASARRTVEALTRLRELSDGFQYQETVDGEETCPLCRGTKHCLEYFDPEYPDLPADVDLVQQGIRIEYNEDYEPIGKTPIVYQSRDVTCTNCGGRGVVPRYIRSMIEVPCPKDEVFLEQLDLHDELGRLNVYAGFTGTIDKLCRLTREAKWGFIKADGRGWVGISSAGNPLPNDKLLEIYASGEDKLAWLAQPGAAGLGLTLTAATTTMFYSNDFNNESRSQAEDRGHRLGMDVERGGHILDVLHLPTDEYVLDNLKKKRDLQYTSLTGLKKYLEAPNSPRII